MSTYIFEVRRFTQDYVNFRLHSMGKFRGYLFEKGRISEEILRRLLRLTRKWQEVTDHPFEDGKSESKRLGPDSLQRSTLSNELSYFEFTWWENSDRAIVHATQQVMRDYRKKPCHEKEPVKGAYLAWLDWNGGRRRRMFVKKVWPV